MSIELYLAFLAAVVLLGLTPGPLWALLTSTSISRGTQAGLRTVAGSMLGLALLAGCVVLGLTSIVRFMADWFDWIKIAGALYLIWLGYTKLRFSGTANAVEEPVDNRQRFFTQGFIVSIANPKVLLFLAAFLPQFISPAYDVQTQLLVYGASFVAAIAVVDLCYVLALGKLKTVLSERKLSLFDKVSGAALMCGGVWLLFARRQ